MHVLDELEKLQNDAMKDENLRNRFLKIKDSEQLYTDLCHLARSIGYDIWEMDLVEAEEEALAQTRKSINGGGENHSQIAGSSDYITLFLSAIDKHE